MRGRPHSPEGPVTAPFPILALLLPAAACVPAPAEPHPALVEAIDHYTGVAGAVDDGRARELLEEAAATGDPLAVMWMARVHSTGRMGFPRDEERAREIAAGVIRKVQRAAESGILEAVFLMGTAYDEGLGKPVDPVRAAVWHRRAAERGHVLGAHVPRQPVLRRPRRRGGPRPGSRVVDPGGRARRRDHAVAARRSL